MTGENGFFDLYLPKKEGYLATFTVYCKEGAGGLRIASQISRFGESFGEIA